MRTVQSPMARFMKISQLVEKFNGNCQTHISQTKSCSIKKASGYQKIIL